MRRANRIYDICDDSDGELDEYLNTYFGNN